MWFYVKHSAKKTYEVCDAAGEKLAWFFGITKPKYYAEIQEYERMDEEVNNSSCSLSFNRILRSKEREAWRQEFEDVEQTDQILDSIVSTPVKSFHPFSSCNP